MHGHVLAVYALLGKGGSYIGLGALYIGEMTLALCAFAALRRGHIRPLLREPVVWTLFALIAFGACRTLVGGPAFGAVALRDAVIWGYAVFALAIPALLLTRVQPVDLVVGWYARMAKLWLVIIPVVFLLGRGFPDWIPAWPGSPVHLLYNKPGDQLVHIAAILGFFALGFAGRMSRALVFIAAAMFVANACMNRGGFLALTFASLVILGCSWAQSRQLFLRFALMVGMIVGLLYVSGVQFVIRDFNSREISFRQLTINTASLAGRSVAAVQWTDQQDRLRARVFTSIQNTSQDTYDRASEALRRFAVLAHLAPERPLTRTARNLDTREQAPTTPGNLNDNTNWRKEWWSAIATQTLAGPQMWFGVGFGTHLAHAFGFTKIPDDSVRSPHSIHVTWLARGGIIGLALWILLNAHWAVSLLRARQRLTRRGELKAANLALFCGAMWTAILVNASFDIYLEGPAGGIWYWSVIGMGIFLIIWSRSTPPPEPSPPAEAPPADPLQPPPHRTLLGMRIDGTSYATGAKQVAAWAQSRSGGFVCAANVHMAMECHDDPQFASVVNQARLVTPDGMPLVWSLRWLGLRDQQRVYGPTLMLHVCAEAERQGLAIGLYGGSEACLERLRAVLGSRFPRLLVGYAYAPPFRALTPAEDEAACAAITASGVSILFVGLGCPKQERWMASHADRLQAVQLGVGAAFAFHAGQVRQAPGWMQRCSLEWLFRLIVEPRRLWRRYAVHNPRFVVFAGWQILRHHLRGPR